LLPAFASAFASAAVVADFLEVDSFFAAVISAHLVSAAVFSIWHQTFVVQA
jgi:hypothetical protein